MGQPKKQWQEPQLMVLVRSKPEEDVGQEHGQSDDQVLFRAERPDETLRATRRGRKQRSPERTLDIADISLKRSPYDEKHQSLDHTHGQRPSSLAQKIPVERGEKSIRLMVLRIIVAEIR